MSPGSPVLVYVCAMLAVCWLAAGQLSSRPRIESRKFSAITGEEAQTKITPQRVNYTIPYSRAFTRKPDVGLSVYNLQFDYNPEFSINVLQEISSLSNLVFYVSGRPSDSNIFNELFIMYIASEYEPMGIFMPGPRNTTAKLGIPSSVANRSEEFTFNYKNIGAEPIFTSATQQANIRVSVYLTGIEGQSETIENGYSKNYAFFALTVSQLTTRFYTIAASVRSTSGEVLIKIIEFTVVYFDITQMAPQYQINSALVLAGNFGGTFFKSSVSLALESLPEDSSYENTLQYFFGISEIECSEGQTINLLAVERFNYNNNGKLQNLLLTFETQRNTFIRRGVYNYIQYKPKTCNDSAACGIPCDDPAQPSYRITPVDNRCAPCVYFCSACENGINCTRCPATRTLSPTLLCGCVNRTLYDDQSSRECQQCIDTNFCQNCSRKGVCETCFTNFNFTFNNVLRSCECSPGTYNSAGSLLRNATALLSRLSTICQACPSFCIYCSAPSVCEACQVQTFLLPTSKTVEGKPVTCGKICSDNQAYNSRFGNCSSYSGDPGLFDEAGRLGFDWQFDNVQNDLVINLLFSQRNMTYYFYENGKGYQFIETSQQQNTRRDSGDSQFYFDDGNGFKSGYSDNSAASQGIDTNLINTGGSNGAGFSFDESALQGQYYGMGEAAFFGQQYKKYQPQAAYFDQFNIPFGKRQLRSTTVSDSATFLDALRNNLLFMIDGQSLPYTIRAISGNQFQMTVRPEKSYLTSNASIVIKNPALVRSGETSLQTPTVAKELDRLDFYSLNQLGTSRNLRDRTATLVQVLWGISKYILFVGFGWAVMPLMLTLQYIFGHNYITSQLPLNLDNFLTSFADFRNPSILFNPERNNFDKQVVNHPEIYKKVAAYQEFDRGIDFMKNSFQFFFVPLLSFGLLFSLMLLNKLFNKVCKKDITLISKYLQPRAGLHAAAYTLVQALPISFFFFGQLQDTRYDSANSPNPIYPSFNTGISYASFFASAIIPLVLLVFIYNYFKDLARSGKFDINKVKGTEEVNEPSRDPARMDDPLWGGNPYKPMSYGFGASVFYLPLLAGFVLSFFTRSYPWQLTGLLLGNLAVGSYAAASSHFDSKVPRFFFVGISALMVAYELVHAGIGSNRALSTYDQWNTGYLGIGIIYAMILTAAIFSGFLIYKLINHLYTNIIKQHGFLANLTEDTPAAVTAQQEQINHRDKALGRDEKRKNTVMKSRSELLNSEERPFRGEGTYRQMGMADSVAYRSPLMGNVYKQDLLLDKTAEDGKALYRCKDSGQTFLFPAWASQFLMSKGPLKIDSQNIVHTENGTALGPVEQFLVDRHSAGYLSDSLLRNSITSDFRQSVPNRGSSAQEAMAMIKNNNGPSARTMLVDGQQVKYLEQDGVFYLLNYKGSPRYQLGINQFLRLFSLNNNRVAYEGNEYYLQKSDRPGYYFLKSVTNFGISKELSTKQIVDLLRSQQLLAPWLAGGLKQSAAQQQDMIPTSSKQNIILTKETQRYVIDGKTYDKISENNDFILLRNINDGTQLSVRKSDVRIRQVGNEQKIGSVRDVLESKLKANNGILAQDGSKYAYKGVQNNQFLFNNTTTNKSRFFTAEELGEALGYRPSQSNIPSQSRLASQREVTSEANLMAPEKSRRVMRLVSTDRAQGIHLYEDPLKSETYEIPVDYINVKQPVYIDDDENIWHNGQMIEVDAQSSSLLPSQDMKNNDKAVAGQKDFYRAYSNQSLGSSGSDVSLSKQVKPNGLYTILVLHKHYQGEGLEIPEDKDIRFTKKNVKGSEVLSEIEKLRQMYAGNMLLFDQSEPDNKYYFTE